MPIRKPGSGALTTRHIEMLRWMEDRKTTANDLVTNFGVSHVQACALTRIWCEEKWIERTGKRKTPNNNRSSSEFERTDRELPEYEQTDGFQGEWRELWNEMKCGKVTKLPGEPRVHLLDDDE